MTATSQNRAGLARASASFCPAQPRRARRARRGTTWPLGSTQSVAVLVGQQAAQHLVGGPRHGGDRRDAEALVDRARGGGRRCGRRPARCRRSRGRCGPTRMLELSPLVTAASAPRSSMPASARWSRSKPKPTTVWPAKPAGRRRKASAFLSTTATVWPLVLEGAGELAADPAASDDDDVQGVLLNEPDVRLRDPRAATPTIGNREQAGYLSAATCWQQIADLDEELGLGGRDVGFGLAGGPLAAGRHHVEGLDDDEERPGRRTRVDEGAIAATIAELDVRVGLAGVLEGDVRGRRSPWTRSSRSAG